MTELLSAKLTTKELAPAIKRAPETLVRWRRLRIGPPFVRVNGRVLYDRCAVEQWLKAQECNGLAA